MVASGSDDRRSVDHVVSIFLAGGFSQLESFDPKPEASVNTRGDSREISTATPGVFFSEWIPNLAQRSKDFAIVRGVSHSDGVHTTAQAQLLTGIADARNETPSLGAVVSRFVAPIRDVPSYAAIPSLPPNAGEFGPSCEPFNVMGDSARLLDLGPDLESSASLATFNCRIQLLNSLNPADMTFRTDSAIQFRRGAYEMAVRNLTNQELRSMSHAGDEPHRVRDAYGDTEAGRFLLTARRLIETGCRFVTVQLAGWDTHADHFHELKLLMPLFDRALAAFLEDLQSRGLLNSTLIVVSTEFGRTPKINTMAGRDHWPQAFSCLLAGGRVRGGMVLGETDKNAAEVVAGRCSPQDIAVTLLTEIGISPLETFVPPTGRVLLPEGRFLQELF